MKFLKFFKMLLTDIFFSDILLAKLKKSDKFAKK